MQGFFMRFWLLPYRFFGSTVLESLPLPQKMAWDFPLEPLNKGLCAKECPCHFSSAPRYTVHSRIAGETPMKTLLFFIFPMLAACQSSPPVATSIPAPENSVTSIPSFFFSPCEQRICTQQYDPVCVIAEHEGHILRQTFANECHICGIVGKVISRHRGECGELQ